MPKGINIIIVLFIVWTHILANICHKYVGKYYLTDSSYANKKGFLSSYKGEKYHLSEFQQGPAPSGKKKMFNHLHSSLHNLIERLFGVLKMKWRILQHLPSYPMEKQTKIIIACIALHNFIRDSALDDELFTQCDTNEDFVPDVDKATTSQPHVNGEEESDMNILCDSIIDGLMSM
jgi:hypothetical protein